MFDKKALNELRENIKSKMSTDKDDKELASYGEMLQQCDTIEKSVDEMEKQQLEYREKYIESIKNYGTSSVPQTETKTHRSLEEIAKEVISKSK